MKKGIIIEARMNSSRLPGKHMLKVNNKPIIQFLFSRLKKVKNKDKIILATTNTSKDDVLVRLAKKNNISIFRGSENNVMQRVLYAAKKFKIDIIIGITADCPLIDPDIIDSCINTFEKNDCDYLNNALIPSYPGGMNCQVYYTKILNKSYRSHINDHHKEHVTLEIIQNKKKYKHLYLCAPTNLYRPSLRIELDTAEDFKIIKKIITKLKKLKNNFSCKEIIQFFDKGIYEV